jgi:predicted transcriptional regulator of viral defense system
MKTKNISYRSGHLLKTLNELEKQYFTIEDAAKALQTNPSSSVRELLRAMVNRGLIMRLKDGLYHVIPYEKHSLDYFPNWHLTAEAIVGDKDYYLGFYTALEIHNLITQPSLVEYIVIRKRVQPKTIKVKNVRYDFITFNKNHFFGYEKTWIDDFNKINCSDLEKTIIDCLYKPDLANGIVEIAKAIYKSRTSIDATKMLMYLERFNAQVVYKRLGFILKHFDILQELTSKLREEVSNSYTLLDPSLPKSGKHNSEWKIVDNVGMESILKSVET